MFVRVAETGSFSAVARERGVTQPAVSRQIAALEEHLGARLVQRTTRSVGLTEEGRDFLGPAQAALLSVEEAESAVGLRHAGIAGLVRLSTSAGFGRSVVAPRIHRLLERHPGLIIDLVLDDPARNMVHDAIDLLVRIGDLPADSSYVVRRIGEFSEVVVGSPAYLDAHPPLEHPRDLTHHYCIIDDRAPHRTVWRMHGAEGTVDVPVGGRFRAESSDARREAALAGLGLTMLSAWLIRDELSHDQLRPVLPDWRFAPVPIHAVYPSRRHLAPRVRIVLDFLIDQLANDPVFSELASA